MNDGGIVVRSALESDVAYAQAAAALIAAAASDHDIALRPVELLREKILHGRAVLALEASELVGFGFWSPWAGGRFVSHSGLVVRADKRGLSLGRRLKLELLASSRRAFPGAILMSLTSSPAVKAMNQSLGFETVPLSELTDDPQFWRGCETCRNFAELQSHRDHCRCDGMILRPPETT